MQAKGMDHPALPRGPTPQGISSQRVLPQVHEVLRQNDPRGLSYSQPAVKKAPPTSGRPMPSVFHSESEPPRIGFQVIHLVLHCQHCRSILLWRRAHVPVSLHWSHQQRKPHRASKFDARHLQSLLNLQTRSMWQHQQLLRCLNLADHVQKVLQLHFCLHPRRLLP